MKVAINKLDKTIRAALLKKYDKDQTEFITPIVMFGELSGRSSHGILRLVSGNMSILALTPKKKPSLKETSKNSILVNGFGNPGMLIGNLACESAINLAKENNIGFVGSKGSIGSSGSLSYYCEKIARENLIGIVMARAPSDVAPFGGLERLFGTNPIAFGIPTDKSPLIFDMATSAISYGAVKRALMLGEKLPEGVAIDEKGNPTTDPETSIKGAFLPFDRSYKGAGLGMMIEILAGVFTGADFLDLAEGDEWGNLFITFKPDLFISKEIFTNRVRKLIERVRNSKTIDGGKVRIYGEKTVKARDDCLRNGIVDVDEKLYNTLEKFVKSGLLL